MVDNTAKHIKSAAPKLLPRARIDGFEVEAMFVFRIPQCSARSNQ